MCYRVRDSAPDGSSLRGYAPLGIASDAYILLVILQPFYRTMLESGEAYLQLEQERDQVQAKLEQERNQMQTQLKQSNSEDLLPIPAGLWAKILTQGSHLNFCRRASGCSDSGAGARKGARG